MTKICIKCEIEKPISEYHKSIRHKGGHTSICKPCALKKTNDWYYANLERSKLTATNWVKNNRDARLTIQRKYRERHRDRLNLEARIRRSKNRDGRCKRQRERQKERMLTDPIYALTRTLRRRFTDALKNQCCNKTTSALKLLGCTIPELKQHLESQFLEGMTWGNRGPGFLQKGGKPILDENGMTILVNQWHIDHIIPCDSFNLSDIEQQKKCFHFSNLRPLWAKDNISKGAKILI